MEQAKKKYGVYLDRGRGIELVAQGDSKPSCEEYASRRNEWCNEGEYFVAERAVMDERIEKVVA